MTFSGPDPLSLPYWSNWDWAKEDAAGGAVNLLRLICLLVLLFLKKHSAEGVWSTVPLPFFNWACACVMCNGHWNDSSTPITNIHSQGAWNDSLNSPSDIGIWCNGQFRVCVHSGQWRGILEDSTTRFVDIFLTHRNNTILHVPNKEINEPLFSCQWIVAYLHWPILQSLLLPQDPRSNLLTIVFREYNSTHTRAGVAIKSTDTRTSVNWQDTFAFQTLTLITTRTIFITLTILVCTIACMLLRHRFELSIPTSLQWLQTAIFVCLINRSIWLNGHLEVVKAAGTRSWVLLCLIPSNQILNMSTNLLTIMRWETGLLILLMLHIIGVQCKTLLIDIVDSPNSTTISFNSLRMSPITGDWYFLPPKVVFACLYVLNNFSGTSHGMMTSTSLLVREDIT